MAYSLSETWASTRKVYNGGDGGLSGEIKLPFEVAGATKIEKGQFVKLSDGYVVPCSATTDVPIGVALQDADNSEGEAGDKEVTVVCRGIAQVNAFIAQTGITAPYDDPLVPFTTCGLSDNGEEGMAGQCVSCGADPTVPVGKMLSAQATSSTTGQTVRALIYIDTLGL